MSILRRKPKPHEAKFGDLFTYERRGSESERVIMFVAFEREQTTPPRTGWHGINLMEPEPVGRGHGWIGFDEYRWRYLGNIEDDL